MTSPADKKPWPTPADVSSAVLLVEDEPDILDAVSEIVQEANPALLVLQATDQEDAKRLYQSNCDAIRLIITDLKLDTRLVGDFAGDEFIAWLATQHSRCPIIILTGYGTMEHLGTKQSNPRIRAYIQKNLPAERLMQVLKREVGLALSFAYDIEVEGHSDWKQYLADGERPEGLAHPADGWFEGSTWEVNPRVDGLADQAGTFLFRPPDIYYRVLDTLDGMYLALDGDELRPLSAPGTPNLPFSIKRIALPQAMADLSVELIDPDWRPFKIAEDWDAVLPVPEHRIEGRTPTYTISKGYWQPARQVFIDRHSTDLDGVPCVTVKLCPFRYLPRSRRLDVLCSTRIRIKGRSVSEQREQPDQARHDSPFAAAVLNWPGPDDDDKRLRSGTPAIDGPHESGSGDERPTYLAVGTQANLDAIQPLLDAHSLRFHIERLEIARTSAPDPNLCEAIRDAIKARREASNGPFYVLLSGGETIPFYRYDEYLTLRYHQDDCPEIDGVPLLSDLYYALFDLENPATGPRLFLGRLPFDDPERLSAYARRAASAETAPGWRHWLFLCSQTTKDWNYRENVRHSLRGSIAGCSLLFGAHRGPAVESSEPVTAARVSELLCQGPTLASFRGHGRRNGWQLVDADYWPDAPGAVQSLTGLHGVLSVACCTAAPDHPRPGCGKCADKSPLCSDSDSLGNSAVERGEASWFLGSTRISFSSANNVLYRSLTRKACERRPLTIGELHWQSLIDLLSGVSVAGDEDQPLSAEDAALIIDTAAMSILLGDPAAPLCPWPVEQTTDALAATASP